MKKFPNRRNIMRASLGQESHGCPKESRGNRVAARSGWRNDGARSESLAHIQDLDPHPKNNRKH